MRRNQYLMIVLVMSILLSASGTALSIDVSYKPILDSIYPTETAAYTVTVTNTGDIDERLQIFTINAYWDIAPSLITVPVNKTITVTLELNPLEDTFVGPQLVPVNFKSLATEELAVENMYVYVRNQNESKRTYAPSIVTEIHTKDSVDPKGVLPIEIYLRNRNPLNLEQLDIAIDSEFFHKIYQTPLGPLEEKTHQVIFDVPIMQAPQTYTVHVRVYRNGTQLAEASKDFVVTAQSDVITDETETRSFLKRTQVIKLVNHGNYVVSKEVRIEQGLFAKLFAKSNHPYHSTKEYGTRYASWTVDLKPEAPVQVVLTTNYMPLFIILIILIIALVLYYILRSPLLIYKRAKIITETEDGISEIKVKLHVKNRSGRTVRAIKILDRYPKITDLEDEGQLGSLKPTKMVSGDKKNSILMWNIEVLEPYEERLVTYKLKSHLHIVGNIYLPSSKVKFHTAAGERTQLSNKVTLMHKSHHSMSSSRE